MGGAVASNPFAWEPFDPSKLPGPKESDPLHRAAFRAAQSGADAYRLTRASLRREGDLLRVGNRFVPVARFREIGFVALGRAAISQALAATESLGARLTQGYCVAPDELPPEVPFRSRTVAPYPVGTVGPEGAADAARELALGLGPEDLLLLLLSPGAFGYLASPPRDGAGAWADRLHGIAAAGGTPAEVAGFARLTATGPIAGRFGDGVRASVATLLVDRGEGAALLGGGPTVVPTDRERASVRNALERIGLTSSLSPAERTALGPDPSRAAAPPSNIDRPVVAAEPADALRDGSAVIGEKHWLPRLAELTNTLPPEAAADRFLARVLPAIQDDGDPAAHGWVVFGPVTLGLLEGEDEGPAMGRFLARCSAQISRPGMTVGLVRTAGAAPGAVAPAGGVVGAVEGGAGPAKARAIPLRPGITDVGCLATAVVPRAPAT